MAGARVLGLLEEVADPGGADADEHLDEVGAGDGEERDAGLAGHGPGQQGLARPRGAEEQDALGDLGPHLAELLGVARKSLISWSSSMASSSAGHVGEGDLRGVLVDDLGPGLAEAHDPVAAALDLVHEEGDDADDQQERERS